MADPRSFRLVTPLTSFVGRDDCIDEIGELLERYRLVTLTGSGGCGKTRLAVEVAATLEPRFADGGFFVDLGPIDSPELVGTIFAAAVGASETGNVPLVDLVADAIGDRHMLLLVDNCERVAEACAGVLYALLRACPRLVVLATSRLPLGVEGEVMWRVPSLSLPAADVTDPVGAVRASEAGVLLLDRARLAKPGFTISAADAQAAVTICRRLDGIPLAIELAAGRLRAFDVGEIAGGLEDRFRLLSAGPRTAPPRQRTLEASIDWSHDLLDDKSRRLFRRLAVFAATFSVEGTEAVCADDELTARDVRAILSELVDQSLVHTGDRIEGARYRLLETVREYARTRLVEAGEESAVRDRHLDYMVGFTAWYDHESEEGDLDEANRRVAPLIDDVRSAIEWSIRAGRVAAGLQLAADLRLHWISQGRNREGQALLAAVLNADGAEDDARAHTRALLAAAELCIYARNPSGQTRLAGEALDAARRLGDRLLEAWALVLVGWAKAYVEPAAARTLLTAGREAAQEAGDRQLVEFASYALGAAEATSGDFGAARDALATGIAIGRSSRKLDMQYGLGLLGYVDTLQGRLPEAIAGLEEATMVLGGDLHRVHRDLSAAWLGLALLYGGRYDEARQRFDEAIAIARAVGNGPVLAKLYLGLFELAMGNHAAAAEQFEETLPELRSLGPWFEVQALVGLAACAAARGDSANAERLAAEAGARADTSHNPLARIVASLGHATTAAIEGDRARTRTLLRSALRAAVSLDHRVAAIDALERLAVLAATDAAPDAARMLAAVDAERARTGYVRFSVDEPAYRTAVGQIQAAETSVEPLPFGEAVVVALGDSRAARPPSGWESLTPAEERVAVLVAEGLTNPEIGERLFISRRTVQAHLSHVFSKLGVNSRAELAAEVSRREQ